MAKEVKRSIIPFKTALYDNNGDLSSDQGLLWRQIKQMPYKDTNDGSERGRIVKQYGRSVSMEIIGSSVDNRIFWGIYRNAVYDDLPNKIDSNEETRPIPMRPDEALEYGNHFMWWDLSEVPLMRNVRKAPPSGVLLIERSRMAPHPTSMEYYLNSLFPRYHLSLELIPVGDPRQELRDAGGALSLKFASTLTQKMIEGNSVSNAAGIMGHKIPEEVRRVEVKLKLGRRMRFSPSQAMKEVEKWRGEPGISEISAELGGGHILDFLEPRIRYTCSVRLKGGRSRTVDPNSMFAELRKLFQKHRLKIVNQLGREWESGVADGATKMAKEPHQLSILPPRSNPEED